MSERARRDKGGGTDAPQARACVRQWELDFFRRRGIRDSWTLGRARTSRKRRFSEAKEGLVKKLTVPQGLEAMEKEINALLARDRARPQAEAGKTVGTE